MPPGSYIGAESLAGQPVQGEEDGTPLRRQRPFQLCLLLPFVQFIAGEGPLADEEVTGVLRQQGDPGAALTEYDVVSRTMPNRLRTWYGAAKSAEAIGERKKATLYFAQLSKLTQSADGDRPELRELKAKLP